MLAVASRRFETIQGQLEKGEVCATRRGGGSSRWWKICRVAVVVEGKDKALAGRPVSCLVWGSKGGHGRQNAAGVSDR